MNNLRITGTLDSREVAKMIGKRHNHLMRDIENYVRYMDELGDPASGVSTVEHNIVASDFFIATTYTSEQNKTLPCYLITRKGCELIGNKLTGVKGVQFAARCVQRFSEMEQGTDTIRKHERQHAGTELFELIEQKYGRQNEMNDLMILDNPEFGQVRTITENGRTLYCGHDVALCLKYTRPSEAVRAHCKGTLKRRTPTKGGTQEMLFIDRGDVVRLIARSDMPEAQRFESWIFDDVVPTVMETGAYIAPGSIPQTSDKLLRAEAMLLNAKTRQYKAIMEAYGDTSGLDPASVRAYSLRAAETVYDMDMSAMLPTSEKTYSATEIGQMLGGTHATTIGKKAGELGLKTPEYAIVVRDITPGHHKPVDCYRYNERAVQKLREYYGYEARDTSITETE